MKKLALCLHDLRASDGDGARRRIEAVQRSFRAPLTVHLVCDRSPEASFAAFLRKGVEAGRLEIAFHGTSHACPRKVGRLLSFYHKHEAEYLADSAELRAATSKAFSELGEKLGVRPGICPPCWLASRENMRLFRSLEPSYIEAMLRMRRGRESRFSPVVSLGSPERRELAALRLFARFMRLLASSSKEPRVRMAIHPCDFSVPESMEFFGDAFRSLSEKGFEAVLLRELLP